MTEISLSATGPPPRPTRSAAGLAAAEPLQTLLAMLLAALVAASLLWLGPPGTDSAAHVYQRWQFLKHGFTVWNNFWYGGRYSFVNYSLLYYPLSAVGIKLLALAAVVVSAAAFSALLRHQFDVQTKAPALAFAFVWGAFVLSGAFPFLLGAAFALVALWALGEGLRISFALFALLTLLASPLAFAFLLVILAGAWLSSADRRRLRAPVVAVSIIALAGLLLLRLFPDYGRFPFAAPQLAAAVAFCLLGLAFTWRIERARVIFCVLVVYLAACLGSFALPSDVGGNVTRLRFLALPLALLILALRRWRPLAPAVVAIVLAASWNLTPLAVSYASGNADHSAKASYWLPAIGYLEPRLSAAYRVEVVDSVGHWGAAYLPEAGIPLARGWFRQDDFPGNSVLYRGQQLTAASYQAWLRRLAVRYVVLPDAPLDYSARAEGALLKSGRSGLKEVYRSLHLVVYALPAPSSLISGNRGARVASVGTDSLRLVLAFPGHYRLAVRYSPYWHSDQACVSSSTDGMTLLYAPIAGTVKLSLDLSAAGAVSTLSGEAQSCALASYHAGMR